jgi:hypothetical protein
MICECGGVFLVEKIHESRNGEPRLCDVKCVNCGTCQYYQPYDFGSNINLIPKSTEE